MARKSSAAVLADTVRQIQASWKVALSLPAAPSLGVSRTTNRLELRSALSTCTKTGSSSSPDLLSDWTQAKGKATRCLCTVPNSRFLAPVQCWDREAPVEHVELRGSRRARSNLKQLPGTRCCEAALYSLLYPHWDQLQINKRDRAVLSGLLGYASFLKT